MTKEKKKALDSDTDITYLKLLKFLHESKSKEYETFNVVTDDGDSIYAPHHIEELDAVEKGQVFYSEDLVRKIIQELEKRLNGDLQRDE
jgi:hypothetical protein